MNVHTLQVTPIPDDREIRQTVAEWSIAEWGDDFPGDTIDTYLDLYEMSSRHPDELPVVFVALDGDTPVGTATLVADDELPGATEPGPWLAATYVVDDARGNGVGGALVSAVENEARRLGHRRLYLYTHDAHDWYARTGWRRLRDAVLTERTVTVMTKDLTAPDPHEFEQPTKGTTS